MLEYSCLLGTAAKTLMRVLTQAQPLASSGSITLSAVIAGSSPQNYFPRSISFGGRQCYVQQMRKQ